ncbi:MAG TPA: AsnC family transcriptional regulator, partial [Thermoanaerobaculaceae bacterium]|nr:AsnC family transcriptional regulator [Thermoanaerobaculaceae bacterium]
MSLDTVDTCIISSLQENGRMPLSEIARRAGVAPATVHERLAKLRKSGIVQGFLVRLNPQMLGYTVTALIHLRTGLAAEVGKTVEGLNA